MKRCIPVVLIVPVLAFGYSCSNKENGETPTVTETRITQPPRSPLPTAAPTPKPSLVVFNNANWSLALTDPEKYKGSLVTLTGKVFTQPQIQAGSVCFQMYSNPEKSEGNTAVCISSADVKSNDFVRITGALLGKFEGSNLFGGSLSIPLVAAATLEKITRSEVVAPALVDVPVGIPITQHGLTIRVDEVEIAGTETRVWITVNNSSGQKASVYDYSALLAQGNRQIESKHVFDSGLPEVPSSVLPGVEAAGVLLFEAIDPNAKQARLVWDSPRTDDYSLDFSDWIWDFYW